VLSALSAAIRRREIWVDGATKWRDPESDLPRDFDVARDMHYAEITQPTDPTVFTDTVASVVNDTFASRDPRWWGTGTACASDSKKFGSWDANLNTEWHARYSGPGVMIYWHVERKSVCVYSQVKTCSSSEVAAMMEGLIRHSADIDSAIEANYTDTHGASIVGFAFCHLLGYRLPPRLKNIGSARLYRPGDGITYPGLETVLSRPINGT
jgi:TnpA family transposase